MLLVGDISLVLVYWILSWVPGSSHGGLRSSMARQRRFVLAVLAGGVLGLDNLRGHRCLHLQWVAARAWQPSGERVVEVWLPAGVLVLFNPDRILKKVPMSVHATIGSLLSRLERHGSSLLLGVSGDGRGLEGLGRRDLLRRRGLLRR